MKKILIVDDDKSNVDFLEEFLNEKYILIKAFNGKEAYELLLKDDFDILLTDINMPIMNGLELSRHTRLYNKNINIILMTGGFIETVGELCNGDFDAIIYKPFRMKDLLEILEST